jgi:hypothetical protein
MDIHPKTLYILKRYFMAEKMKLLAPDATGKLCETIGDSMEIREAKEPWSEYVLEDGIKIPPIK